MATTTLPNPTKTREIPKGVKDVLQTIDDQRLKPETRGKKAARLLLRKYGVSEKYPGSLERTLAAMMKYQAELSEKEAQEELPKEKMKLLKSAHRILSQRNRNWLNKSDTDVTGMISLVKSAGVDQSKAGKRFVNSMIESIKEWNERAKKVLS